MKDYNEIKTKPASEIFDIINTFKNDHRKRVAITEASGYLGIYLVRELCQKSDIEKVHCIGRSNSMSELKMRMASIIKKIKFEKNNKLELVIGDITQNNCGIEFKKLDEIKNECHTLIHCATIVN